jgi:hypothetical protein
VKGPPRIDRLEVHGAVSCGVGLRGKQKYEEKIASQDWNLRRPHSVPSASRETHQWNQATLRRFVGILTSICALYLTVGEVDAPCNDHSRGSSASGAVMLHHDGPHKELPARQSDQPKPCKSAATPCCVAMASCGTTIAAGASVPSTGFSLVSQIVPPSHSPQPPSRIAAPEPPPPKA